MSLLSITHNLLPTFVAIPLGSAFLISLAGKTNRRIGDTLASLATFVLLAFSVGAIGSQLWIKTLVYKVGSWPPPFGICLVLDGLSSFMLVITNLVSFLVAIYSIGYMEVYTEKWKFHTLFLLMLAGMNGVILSGDMFNLYVFLEIAAVASYALVAFGTEEEELEASFKYAVMGIVASCFILLSIAVLYSFTSTLNMADMAHALGGKPQSPVVLFVTVLLLVGFGLKAAIVPFHAWLPDAHPSAPASISAMLSAVLIKVLGVYAMVRIFFSVFGFSQNLSTILIYLGTFSMLVGAFLAIGQFDIKRMLAYSSVSQIGYIVLSLGIATPLAILGGLFHLFNHAIFKSLLFLNSGAIEYSTGTRDLRKMGGLNSSMPITGASSMVASLSISGVPPFGGFWSKLIIIFAAIQAREMVVAGLAVLASIVTLAYYLRLQKFAFFGEPQEKSRKIREVPFSMKLSMIILAILCLIAGLFLILNIPRESLQAAVDVLLKGRDYTHSVFEAIK